MFPGTPTGYPTLAQSPVQTPSTPTMQAPPPYGQPPGTPTEAGYYSNMQHQPHQGAVGVPIRVGVSIVCTSTCPPECMSVVECRSPTENIWQCAIFLNLNGLILEEGGLVVNCFGDQN